MTWELNACIYSMYRIHQSSISCNKNVTETPKPLYRAIYFLQKTRKYFPPRTTNEISFGEKLICNRVKSFRQNERIKIKKSLNYIAARINRKIIVNLSTLMEIMPHRLL